MLKVNRELVIAGTLVFFGSACVKSMLNYSRSNPPDKCVQLNLSLASVGILGTGALMIYENIKN
jgi:hypothetical protein